jgi:phosphatidate cytidylyltransferase
MKRVVTSLILIPLVVGVVLAAPFWVFAAVVAAVGLLAFHEFDQIAKAQGIPPAGWPGMAAGVVLLFAPEPFVMAAIAAVAAMMLALRVRDLASALPSAAAFLLGVMYIFGAWRCGIELREINPHWLMIALLVRGRRHRGTVHRQGFR